MKYLIIVLLLLSFNVDGGTLYLGQKSYHFDIHEKIKRESHSLLIYENNSGYMAGYWRNSYDKDTFSIGHHYKLVGQNDITIGFKYGLVSGYHYPVFACMNFGYKIIDVNFVPTEAIAIGFKFKI